MTTKEAPMPVTLTSLVLPAPFDQVTDFGAWITYGKRKVAFSVIDQPGVFARNQYQSMWVDIEEREPWRGEPLWVSPSRRPPGTSFAREPFTEPARKAMSDLLLPVVARYGFDRWWTELHQGSKRMAANEQALEDAVAIVDWWRRRNELAEMWSMGLLSARPIVRDTYRRGPMVTQLRTYGRGTDSNLVAPVAELWADGGQVGWLTEDSEVVPL